MHGFHHIEQPQVDPDYNKALKCIMYQIKLLSLSMQQNNIVFSGIVKDPNLRENVIYLGQKFLA